MRANTVRPYESPLKFKRYLDTTDSLKHFNMNVTKAYKYTPKVDAGCIFAQIEQDFIVILYY
jgi:hypothetical protein